MIWNSLPELAGTLWNPPDLPEVSHLLQLGTSSTRARGQDDVSSNQLPQITVYYRLVQGFTAYYNLSLLFPTLRCITVYFEILHTILDDYTLLQVIYFSLTVTVYYTLLQHTTCHYILLQLK